MNVRLDSEVLHWLRSEGEGHLTRINDIRTNLMEAERRMGRGTRLSGWWSFRSPHPQLQGIWGTRVLR